MSDEKITKSVESVLKKRDVENKERSVDSKLLFYIFLGIFSVLAGAIAIGSGISFVTGVSEFKRFLLTSTGIFLVGNGIIFSIFSWIYLNRRETEENIQKYLTDSY